MMTNDEVLSQVEILVRDRLQSLEILRGVNENVAWGVLRQCRIRQVAGEEILLTKGQRNNLMFIVVAGCLGVYLEEPPAEPITQLGTGQTVGEMSVIDRSPASAHVIAIKTSLLLEVDDETFWRLVNASHQFSVNLLHLFAQRMRANNTSLYRATITQREFERDATIDALTGLYNRRWWDDKFERIVGRAHRSGQPLSLIVIDVDRFKDYNDTYGHLSGDTALRVVAKTLVSSLRPTDIAARYGGEEFVAALPAAEFAGATVAAERARQAVADAVVQGPTGERLQSVTISLGVATLRAQEGGGALFARADAAVYAAKRDGRNRVHGEEDSG